MIELKNIQLKFRTKLALVIVASSMISVLAVSAISIYMHSAQFKENRSDSLRLKAELLSENLQAALAFEDYVRANEVLNILSFHPEISGACLYQSSGAVISRYQKNDRASIACEKFSSVQSPALNVDHLMHAQKIFLDLEHLGTLNLYMDSELIKDYEIKQIQYAAATFIFVLVIVSYPLSIFLRRVAYTPIRQLAYHAQSELPVLQPQGSYLVSQDEVDQIRMIINYLKKEAENNQKVSKSKSLALSRSIANSNLSLGYLAHKAQTLHKANLFFEKYTESLSGREVDGLDLDICKEISRAHVSLSDGLQSSLQKLQNVNRLSLDNKEQFGYSQFKNFKDLADSIFSDEFKEQQLAISVDVEGDFELRNSTYADWIGMLAYLAKFFASLCQEGGEYHVVIHAVDTYGIDSVVYELHRKSIQQTLGANFLTEDVNLDENLFFAKFYLNRLSNTVNSYNLSIDIFSERVIKITTLT